MEPVLLENTLVHCFKGFSNGRFEIHHVKDILLPALLPVQFPLVTSHPQSI